MEVMKRKSEFLIPKKRRLDEVEEYSKMRTLVSKYPPPKIRTGVRVFRDFPVGCGTVGNSVGSKAEMKPLVKRDNVALNRVKPKEPGRNKLVGVKRESKVKFWDPTCSIDGDAGKQVVTTTVTVVSRRKALMELNNVDSRVGDDKLVSKVLGSKPVGGKLMLCDPSCSGKQEESVSLVSQKEQVRREKIKEAMVVFEKVNEELYQVNRLKPKEEKIAHWRVPLEAAKIVQQKLKWMDSEKILGPVCGVQVGDTFRYRSQLKMIGLHCQPLMGIDYTEIKGKNLALSIVDAHRYSNGRATSDTLTYSGQGGLMFLGGKVPPEDQKLERGNLALKNTMVEKTPVRVIRKTSYAVGRCNEVFVYDGLYIVKNFKEKKGAEGKMVFQFELTRVPGQQALRKVLDASR